MPSYRDVLRFPIEQYSLDNGLHVLLHHDDSLPIVAVNLWYRVGSKDEDRSRTGLAHLFEHLMFEGSANHNDDYFKPLQEAGGQVNGSTSNDRTRYFEVVPSQFLELAIWMEAERLANLLPALSQDKLDNQRSVVKNERRQRVDNQPYGRVGERLAQLLFPEDHPYSWPVLGWMEHLDACSLKDLSEFFQSFYRPGNITLAIVGCFDDRQARHWVEEYFAPIPDQRISAESSESRIPHPQWDGERRLCLEEPVALPRIDLVWLTQPRFHADEAPLDYAAHILGGRSKDSRLKRRLIHDEKLATTASAYHETLKLAGQFGLRVYGLEEADLKRVEAVVLEEVDRLCQMPPDDVEMQRVRNTVKNHSIARLETVLGKAESLQQFLFYEQRLSPASFVDELERYEGVTAEDVRRAADKYFSSMRAVVEVHVATHKVTSGRQENGQPANKPIEKRATNSTVRLPSPGAAPAFRLRPIERATSRCGMRIVLVRNPKLPRVDCLLLCDAGAASDPNGRFGLARLCGDVLDEGTTVRDGLAIARQLDRLGAQIAVTAGVETATIALRSLTEHLEDAFAVFAEVIALPRFLAEDLDRERKRLLAELAHRAKRPSSLAADAIDAAIFGPDHPYGRPADGCAETVQNIQRDDLVTFHRCRYRPDSATLLVVGDTSIETICSLVDQRFPHRTETSSPANTAPFPSLQSTEKRLTVVPLPGAAQSVLRIGSPSVARKSPDYFALLLLNTILGGQFASRLNSNLREHKGYTYGASSRFHLRRHGGSFQAGADVENANAVDAVLEALSEIADISARKPVSAEELGVAKAYLSRRFPIRFETGANVIGHLAQIAVFDLPDDYYDLYLPSLAAVTLEQVRAAAQRHLVLDAMKVVMVGEPQIYADLEPRICDLITAV